MADQGDGVSVDYAPGKMEQLSDRGYSYIHTKDMACTHNGEQQWSALSLSVEYGKSLWSSVSQT